jgi:hypothetical protein
MRHVNSVYVHRIMFRSTAVSSTSQALPYFLQLSCGWQIFSEKTRLHKTRGLISSATVCLKLLILTQEVFHEVPQVEVCLHVVLTKTEFRQQI